MDIQEIGQRVRGLHWSGSGQVVGCCECSNEPPLSTKYGEYLV